ncbi:MAG TPA: ABC transporter permease [Burkholderiales bacterium]|jgi:putative ABC transport system permease protein|nr:ABC transporter permease [Burkholderiales bacterium]
MRLPVRYTLRNLWTRKLTTVLTAGGMALVVFVFAAVQMLDTGLRATLVATGQPDNVLITRRGSNAEISSGVDRVQAAIVESQPEIATGADGKRQVSKEAVILITLPKRESGQATNVTTRGVGEAAYALRPQVRFIQGRPFERGASEVVVGKSLAERFESTGLGSVLRFGGREWRVVGIFDSGGAAFDSEVWADSDQLMQAFRRQAYSSVIARLIDAHAFDAIKSRLESDPRLTLDVKRERVFYEEQSQALSKFISYLGLTLSIIFSIGAMIGAMITMYAAVASRVAEIGTLRALGYRRSAVLGAFLFESVLLGAIGGAVGIGLASFMQLVQISTLNWQSFAELAFRFTLTPKIALVSFAFAVLMGVVGGFLPAVRAARMSIVDALRAA